MPDYAEGKIYKIISKSTNKIYIGSTCQALWSRLAGHKRDYQDYLQGKKNNENSAFDIVQFSDCKIILIENYKCKNKEQLRSREQHHIDSSPNCVNKQMAYTGIPSGLTIQEYRKAYKKTEKGKENIRRYQQSEKSKQYHHEYSKKYEKQTHIKQQRKKYYDNKKFVAEFIRLGEILIE